jgi:hypothetical protein
MCIGASWTFSLFRDACSELDDNKRGQGSDLLARIVAMLTKLCR